jgi:hypothetical protein
MLLFLLMIFALWWLIMSNSRTSTRFYTKQMTALNVVAAWLTLLGSMWVGTDMAAIVAPVMVALIAALLGCYQVIGNLDLRAVQKTEILGDIHE